MKTLGAALIIVGALHSYSFAQQLGDLQAFVPKTKSHVTYMAEPQRVAANQKSWLDLSFQVESGFHINSHKPDSELLIPTMLTPGSDTGVAVDRLEYPDGTSYSFPAEPEEKLNVYTGDFHIRILVIAKSGAHKLTGTLRYQACDQAACLPPRTLPVEALFVAQ